MSNRESEHQHAHFTYTDERGNAHDVSIALDEQIQVAVDIRTRGEAGDVAHNRERLRHSLINAGISVTDVVITQKR
jgi:hypothetical protein